MARIIKIDKSKYINLILTEFKDTCRPDGKHIPFLVKQKVFLEKYKLERVSVSFRDNAFRANCEKTLMMLKLKCGADLKL